MRFPVRFFAISPAARMPVTVEFVSVQHLQVDRKLPTVALRGWARPERPPRPIGVAHPPNHRVAYSGNYRVSCWGHQMAFQAATVCRRLRQVGPAGSAETAALGGLLAGCTCILEVCLEIRAAGPRRNDPCLLALSAAAAAAAAAVAARLACSMCCGLTGACSMPVRAATWRRGWLGKPALGATLANCHYCQGAWWLGCR